MNLNRVLVAGHLTRDPEVRQIGTDRVVANFGLAINSKFKTADGQAKEETTFLDVECWNRTAELVGQYLTKGSGAFLEGRLKLDTWDDGKTGQKRSKLKLVAEHVQFLGEPKERPLRGPASEAHAPGPTTKAALTKAPAGATDDEPPF